MMILNDHKIKYIYTGNVYKTQFVKKKSKKPL